MGAKDSTIIVHGDKKAKDFVKWASKCRGQTLNSFMLYSSITEAEKVLSRIFANWDGKFERILDETIETVEENKPE